MVRTGKPGTYSIHHRPVDEDDDDECPHKASSLSMIRRQVSRLQPLRREDGNIVGDNESGYVLTEDNTELSEEGGGQGCS